MVKVKNEASEILQSTILAGYVTPLFPCDGPFIVAAFRTNQGENDIVHYMRLQTTGEFELMVKEGSYRIIAFWDKNNNAVYDRGEPAGQYENGERITAGPGGVLSDIDVAIPAGGETIALPYGAVISDHPTADDFHRTAGSLKKLDDDLFSEGHGGTGFWTPHNFFNEIGTNIYLLEKYDPEKIPILFIHGAGGTPKGWRFFIDNLDRSRYQPWVFYYPTGARLKSSAYLLFWKLFNLQLKYKFSRLYITAHSMGGLVARSFIIDYGQYFPCLKLFISLATPWGGDIMADYGVKQSPVIVPNWIDMQAKGTFIQSIYKKKLPEDMSFYIFYGYAGTRSGFNSNNDGTITFASLLDWRAQSEAERCFAFNEDHASIILSQSVVDQYNTVIDQFENPPPLPVRQSKGYLKLNYSFDYHGNPPLPWPVLVLRPEDKDQSEKTIYLNGKENHIALGPLPVGNYRAGLIAMGAKTDNNWLPLTIKNNQTTSVRFTLAPEGMISDHVYGADRAMQQPDKKSQREIDSFTLIGENIHRTLHPGQCKGKDIWKMITAGDDFSCNDAFHFFNLPAGKYQVLVNFNHKKSTVKNYTVIPGSPSSPKRLRSFGISPEKLYFYCENKLIPHKPSESEEDMGQTEQKGHLYNFFLWLNEKYENLF